MRCAASAFMSAVPKDLHPVLLYPSSATGTCPRTGEEVLGARPEVPVGILELLQAFVDGGLQDGQRSVMAPVGHLGWQPHLES